MGKRNLIVPSVLTIYLAPKTTCCIYLQKVLPILIHFLMKGCRNYVYKPQHFELAEGADLQG